MSVGGQVVRVVHEKDAVWVSTREIVHRRGVRGLAREQVAIYVQATDEAREIKTGDSLWWQGRNAYWTPKPDDGREDVPIPRIGYSHEPKKLALVK